MSLSINSVVDMDACELGDEGLVLLLLLEDGVVCSGGTSIQSVPVPMPVPVPVLVLVLVPVVVVVVVAAVAAKATAALITVVAVKAVA
jgi:hypothetical protein